VGPYIVSADDLTVTDTSTGLVWQRDGSGPRAGCSGKSGLPCTWSEAIAYCTGLNLDGSGWRLPTKDELVSIVDTTVTSGPEINQTAFPTRVRDFLDVHAVCWLLGNAWFVGFGSASQATAT